MGFWRRYKGYKCPQCGHREDIEAGFTGAGGKAFTESSLRHGIDCDCGAKMYLHLRKHPDEYRKVAPDAYWKRIQEAQVTIDVDGPYHNHPEFSGPNVHIAH
mmetsp:Transcript_50270/g.57693  ORF Transcript_50270/g.57693 Transcript_50270/m.57693 type:complete len:102 (-) Transcript_50270:632-937(-)